jgi:pimeloyl-ACP methyl ester carboxylesterase
VLTDGRRWGMGRTAPPAAGAPDGIPEWAAVVEEALDRLGVRRFSVLAHSAGAPYALALANRLAPRVVGDVCLLAPWVGGSDHCACRRTD